MHSTAKHLRGGGRKKLQGTMMQVSLQKLRKQIKDELLGLSTHLGPQPEPPQGIFRREQTSPARPWRFTFPF